VAECAARLAFQAKLDFFNEGRTGVSTAALHVWWADLEVVVGALDAALSSLAAATQAAGAMDAESTPAAVRAASVLVAAVARANATCAPLGHRMLDEALAALHRQHALGRAGGQPLLPLLAADSGQLDGPQPLPPAVDACDVITPQTPALLGLACLGGLLACEEVVALHFGSNKPTARLAASALPQLLTDVGLRAPQKLEQLEALAARLGSVSGDPSLEAGPVAQGFTGARLKLERLQAALLYATGSVAATAFDRAGTNNISGLAALPLLAFPAAALVDDDCAERLESALDAALVPTPVPVNSHPLVVQARRVLADRRNFATGQPGQNHQASGLSAAAAAARASLEGDVVGALAAEADDAAWHLVESTSDPANAYWYNQASGESRWDTPERIRAEVAAAAAAEGGDQGQRALLFSPPPLWTAPSPTGYAVGSDGDVTAASSAQFVASAGAAVAHFRGMLDKLQAVAGTVPTSAQHARLS
jgi:hypothetical protein